MRGRVRWREGGEEREWWELCHAHKVHLVRFFLPILHPTLGNENEFEFVFIFISFLCFIRKSIFYSFSYLTCYRDWTGSFFLLRNVLWTWWVFPIHYVISLLFSNYFWFDFHSYHQTNSSFGHPETLKQFQSPILCFGRTLPSQKFSLCVKVEWILPNFSTQFSGICHAGFVEEGWPINDVTHFLILLSIDPPLSFPIVILLFVSHNKFSSECDVIYGQSQFIFSSSFESARWCVK